MVDQSILDESSQMLEFLQKENAKVKDENARLHRDVKLVLLMLRTAGLPFDRTTVSMIRLRSFNERLLTYGNRRIRRKPQ